MIIPLRTMRHIVREYLTAFPGWQMLAGSAMVRAEGPLMQGIGFERFDNESYVPTTYLRVLVRHMDVGAMPLARRLKIEPQGGDFFVEKDRHALVWTSVVVALKQQLRPSTDEPLKIETAISLYEEFLNRSVEGLHALDVAILHALIGNNTRAVYWCNEVLKLEKVWRKHSTPWWQEALDMASSLPSWIESGDATSRLNDMIATEKQTLGIEDN